MTTILKIAAVAATAMCVVGCASVSSSRSPTTASTGDAWYTTNVGLPMMPFSTHIYYCPKPAGPGPINCKEAKYVEAAK